MSTLFNKETIKKKKVVDINTRQPCYGLNYILQKMFKF